MYVFEESGGVWTSTKKIVPEGGGVADLFGGAVALRDGVALIGAPNTDEACPGWVNCNSGSAMVYDLGSDSYQHTSCPSPAGPCGNHDGWGGCVNSTGFGAVLSSCGSGSLAADDLSLHGRWLPSSALVILLMGGGSNAPTPFGDGLFCIAPGGAGTNRMHLGISTPTGHVAFGPGLHGGLSGTPFQALRPGDERHYQLWFRDPSGPCGSGSNLSNALRVDFRP